MLSKLITGEYSMQPDSEMPTISDLRYRGEDYGSGSGDSVLGLDTSKVLNTHAQSHSLPSVHPPITANLLAAAAQRT